MTIKKLAIDLPWEEIKKFCQKWKIQELSVFGSILRDDFNLNESDIDMLYVFSPESSWGWEIVDIESELEKILGRKVDFFSKRSIEKSKNHYKKESILGEAQVIYEQAK